MAELKFSDEQVCAFRGLAAHNSRFLFYYQIKVTSGYSGNYTRHYRIMRGIAEGDQIEVQDVTWHVAKATDCKLSKDKCLMCSHAREVTDLLNRRYAVFLDRSTILPNAPKEFVHRGE